jgi:hypothetical protein
MLVLYLLDTAAHRPPGSVLHLLSILSCMSFLAEFLRSRALALWEWRESNVGLLPLNSSPANRETARSHVMSPLRAWTRSLDRCWSSRFVDAMNWPVLLQMGLAGGALLTVARGIGALAPGQQIARVPFGFSGILLIDASLGLGAFLLLYHGNAARRLRQIREWLRGPW